MSLEPITLQGQHVCLEPLEMRHFEALLGVSGDPEIWRFMSFGQLSTPERLRGWIESIQHEPEQGLGLPFAIVQRESGQVCGSTSLYQVNPQHRRLELGRTWLGRAFWRTAVNTESKYLLLCHAFEGLGANRVEIKTNSQNFRSQRAIERLGATREGLLRSYSVWSDGSVRDTVMYSIIRSEWPQVKKRLEDLLER